MARLPAFAITAADLTHALIAPACHALASGMLLHVWSDSQWYWQPKESPSSKKTPSTPAAVA